MPSNRRSLCINTANFLVWSGRCLTSYFRPRRQIWGFVLTDDASSDDDHTTKVIKGYILGSSDTRAFERATEGEWWPALKIRFPLSSEVNERTTADQDYIDLIHRAPDVAPEACLAVSPAHMHVNLLPEVQRHGWGRKLIECAVDHLRGQQIGALWVGIDGRNVAARIFYEKLGFRGIEGALDIFMALNFERLEWARSSAAANQNCLGDSIIIR